MIMFCKLRYSLTQPFICIYYQTHKVSPQCEEHASFTYKSGFSRKNFFGWLLLNEGTKKRDKCPFRSICLFNEIINVCLFCAESETLESSYCKVLI